MNDRDLTVPTARQCLAEAYRELQMFDGKPERAAQWIIMARELREEAMMRAPGRPPAERPTLHDVLAVVCAHGKVAVQWKAVADTGWWLHVEDGTSCDYPDAPGDPFRRRSQAMREATGPEGTMGAEQPADDEPTPGDAPTEVVELVYAVGGPMPEGAPAMPPLPLDYGQRIEDDPATTLVRPFVDGSQWDRAAERHRLDVTAALPFPVPRQQPEEGQQAECRNHDEASRLIYQDGKWVHVSTGQALCPIPGQTPEGDETYHGFANPK